MTNSQMDTDQRPNDIRPLANDAARILGWLINMGADEIVSEHAVDRFAASASVEKQPAKALATDILPSRPAALSHQLTADAARQAGARNTIGQLAECLNNFDAQPLRKAATQLCFFEGNPLSPILILGDRPRTEEDKSGQVFAGKSRELLTRMLAAINVKIADVGLMNFVPWRPPGNRAPLENEISLCLPFAARALELMKPRLILSFGALGGQYLAGGDGSIIRQRGKWQKVGGGLMMATMHPDELLKLPAQKRLAWRDLLAFRIEMDEFAP